MNDDFTEIMNSLSENARFAIQKADIFAKRYNKGYVGTEHILLGILDQDVSTGAHILADEDIILEDIEEIIARDNEEEDFSFKGNMAMMSISEAGVLTLRMASLYARELGLKTIGTEHLLHALVYQPNSHASELLKECGIDFKAFTDDLDSFCEAEAKERLEAAKKPKKPLENLKYLTKYGRDLVAEATAGRLDTVIGRDQEIERAVTVLCRRTKSNPVLIGEAGVGKTAIVEGLASRIAKGNVPSHLIGKHVYEVDLSSLVAGTHYRGDFEERIKGIIDEAVKNPQIIMFIDEIHLLVGAGAGEGNMDAANILKPALARGEICLIGATTSDEYRKFIEKDHALSRRFQTVMVEEPSAAVTLRILKGIKKHYESHHNVTISDDILSTAISMSSRYINDRYMPDKVIDIIDEASAIAKVAFDKTEAGKILKLQTEEKSLKTRLEKATGSEDFEKVANIKTRLAQIKKETAELKKKFKGKPSTPKVTEAHLATAISLRTGIPVSKVHGSEMTMLLNLEDHLKKQIIGQDEAVDTVSAAIRRGRSGISDPRRPIGSFLFMGPTGVGKTELARVLAREVFGGENALIKIDMSEFAEKHNVSRLVGAPAGYVGYEDGGKLTETVRRRPYSVILFDEIEKAHPDALNILLQILEDGTLTDGHGNHVKFNNTIVILTSNLGASEMYDDQELGFSVKTKADEKRLAEEYEYSKEAAMRALKKAMRPELINRLDSILVFHALTHKQIEKIFDNLVEDLKKRLAEKSLGLKISPEAKNWLIEQGYDPKNGARPLRRVIESKLESLLSDTIIRNGTKRGQILLVDFSNRALTVKTEEKEK